MPAGTDFANASPGCSESGGTVTCNLGTIPAGESKSVWVEVRTDQGLPDPTTVTNTAGVTSPTDPGALPGNPKEDSEDTLVNQSPLNPTDLMIEKSGDPPTVVAGETLTYTLTVTNNGPADATSVVVVDALPSGVSFVSATPSQGTCNEGVTCALGDLADGAVATITIVVNVNSDQFEPLINYARVQASNPDTDPENNEDNEVSLITPVETIADVAIEKVADPDPAIPGEELVYEITVTNFGPSDAPNVIINENVPQELESVVVQSSKGTCYAVDEDTHSHVCEIGTMAVDEVVIITVTGIVAGDTTNPLTNTAWISDCGCTTNPDDNNDVSIITPVEPNADLAINKSATATAEAGGVITYTIDVINYGPSTATGVVITDTFPAGVTPQIPVSPQTECSVTDVDEAVCDGFDLLSGETASFTLWADVDAGIVPGSSLENVAVVGSETADKNPFNNQDDADTSIISEADLGVTKTCADPVNAGEQVVCTIEVTNYGSIRC